jgi:nucleoside-diphosphate-sugar epimerase
VKVRLEKERGQGGNSGNQPVKLLHISLPRHPKVIVHTAAPLLVTGTLIEYWRIAVDGTIYIRNIAKDSPAAPVLIYTYSSTMVKRRKHLNLDEDFPLTDADPAYAQTTAMAEIMMLDANYPLARA